VPGALLRIALSAFAPDAADAYVQLMFATLAIDRKLKRARIMD
jgi:hypothetical protein